MNVSQSDESIWTPGARLTLLAAIVFVALNAAQIGYRLTIPSLGWAGPDPETLDEVLPYVELDFNAVGVPSALEPGDIVQAVEGIPPTLILDDLYNSPKPDNWKIGELVELTVLRHGQTLSLGVPLTHWTTSAWLLTNFSSFDGILEWLVTLLLVAVGAFTFFKRPANLSARFLFAFGLANLSITLGDSIPDYSAMYFDLPAVFAKVFFSNIVFAYLIGPSFLGYALSFPKPKPFVQRQSRWLLAPYMIGSITIVLLLTAPELADIGFLLTFGMVLLGVIALVHSGVTMRDAISRAQLRWAIGGVTLGAAVFLLNFASGVPQPYGGVILAVADSGTLIIGLSLAIAILRYRLFDIDVIIRRTLQYSMLTGMLALVYFGSVLLLQSIFESITRQSSPIAIVISTLLIAAIFNPLRSRIQDFIDRRFFRKKYNAEKILAAFSTVARDEVDMDQFTTALLGVVEETMQPEKAELLLIGTENRGYHE